MAIPPHIHIALQKRHEAGNLRKLPSQEPLVDFCSNDYLGLAQNAELAKLIHEKVTETNFSHLNGATGSRLISGNDPIFEETETFLSKIFKTEACLIFNSGYVANMGVLSSVPQKGDTILYDELSHACIKDGIRLSFADRFPFKHNNVNDLENKLKKAVGTKYIVVESIYSMDGDAAPLKEICQLAEQYEAYVIVDEAHSTGIFGENGSGLVCSLGLDDKVFIRIHTFGKAMGVHGACVAAQREVIDFLVNFSRPFIYTTAMPLHAVVSIKCAFEYLKTHAYLQEILSNKIELFLEKSKQTELHQHLIPSQSAIQAFVVKGNEKAKFLSEKAKNAGFYIKPILSPTVKEGSERLRICLHSYNSENEIDNVLKQLTFM